MVGAGRPGCARRPPRHRPSAGRQSAVESEDYPTLATLGLEQRQLVGAGHGPKPGRGDLRRGRRGGRWPWRCRRSHPSARRASPSPRRARSSTPSSSRSGSLAMMVVVVALGMWPAVRAARTVRADDVQGTEAVPQSSWPSLAATGALPSAVIGVRHALQRGRGRATVPVGTALLGTALAVTALCGTAVFGASLSHLTATPNLYGEPVPDQLQRCQAQPDPTLLGAWSTTPPSPGVTRGVGSEISIDKVTRGGRGRHGVAGAACCSPPSAGICPAGDGQVALGASTMRQVGAHVGSVVPVTVTSPSGGKRDRRRSASCRRWPCRS